MDYHAEGRSRSSGTRRQLFNDISATVEFNRCVFHPAEEFHSESRTAPGPAGATRNAS